MADTAPLATDRYRIYLRGELAKLRHGGDAEAFLDRGRCDLDRLRLPDRSAAVTAAFGDQAQVNRYVETLTHEEAVELTECCGRWRRNGIAERLATLQETQYVSVPVASILLRPAERDLAHIFERNRWRLPAIASDAELMSAEPYRSCRAGQPVDFAVCLAEPSASAPGMFRMIDGMHRAIQLFRNGEPHITLCVISEGSR
jgi:hypothetical protein